MYWDWGDNSRRKSEGQGTGVLLTLEGSNSNTLGEGFVDNPRPTTTSLLCCLGTYLSTEYGVLRNEPGLELYHASRG